MRTEENFFDRWLENPGLRLRVTRDGGIFQLHVYDCKDGVNDGAPVLKVHIADYRAKDLAYWIITNTDNEVNQ
jgi:hypothetical protein